jgi:hypothetical protein
MQSNGYCTGGKLSSCQSNIISYHVASLLPTAATEILPLFIEKCSPCLITDRPLFAQAQYYNNTD